MRKAHPCGLLLIAMEGFPSGEEHGGYRTPCHWPGRPGARAAGQTNSQRLASDASF